MLKQSSRLPPLLFVKLMPAGNCRKVAGLMGVPEVTSTTSAENRPPVIVQTDAQVIVPVDDVKAPQPKVDNSTKPEVKPKTTNTPQLNAMMQAIDNCINTHDCDLYLFSGNIWRNHAGIFVDIVTARKTKRHEVTILLTTLGGDPHAAYQMIRCLSEHYKCIRIIIAGPCKSAGTLIAIGAHELVFGPHGEIGPLDVQLGRPDELVRMTSGLDTLQAFDSIRQRTYGAWVDFMLDIIRKSQGAISTRTAADIAKELTIGLISPVAGQIDPHRLGEAERSMRIAEDYGRRVESGNLKRETLAHLVRGYAAHGCVIDRIEAEKLFKQVRVLDESESVLIRELSLFVLQPWQVDDDEEDHAQVLDLASMCEAEKSKLSQEGKQNADGNPTAKGGEQRTGDVGIGKGQGSSKSAGDSVAPSKIQATQSN